MTEYEKWSDDLDKLNTRINNLKVWDDYAEYLQGEYDRLLDRDPRRKDDK